MATFMKPDPEGAKEYFEKKLRYTAGPVEVAGWQKQKQEINVVDVRRSEHFDAGHVPGAVNLPKDKWNSLEGLDKNKTNILYCYSQQCHLAPEAAVLFADKGYSVMEMEGGFKAWEDHELEVEEGAPSGSFSGAAGR
jgi:rhodanese-related sulfurtransferase